MQRFLISVAAIIVFGSASGTAWALPDLMIFQFRNHDTAAENHNPSMHVWVKNQGLDPAPGCLLKVQVVRQGQILATRIVVVPPLAAGAVSPPLLVLTTPHVHPRIVRMKVDAGNQVAEANEANNVREVPLL